MEAHQFRKNLFFDKTFWREDEVVLSAVSKLVYFAKPKRQHFLHHVSHDQQQDVTIDRNIKEVDNRK